MNNQLSDRFVEIPHEPEGLWDLIMKHAAYLGFPPLISSYREVCDNFINFMDGTSRRVPYREDVPSQCTRISLDEFFNLTPEPPKPVKKSITLELTEEQEASVRAVLGERL